MYWFDRAIRESQGVDGEMYLRTRQQKLRLMQLLGKAGESVEQQKKELEAQPERVELWTLLTVAYIYAQRYEEADHLVQTAMEKFPAEWELCIHASGIARHLGEEERALCYAERAIALRPDFVDGKYEKAWSYEKLGKYKEAAHMYMEIADAYQRDGLEVEAETELRNARRLMERAEG